MSAFLALLANDEAGLPGDFLDHASTAIAPFGQTGLVTKRGRLAALAANNPPARPAIHAIAPDGTVIVGWARLDERKQLAEGLDLEAAHDDGILLLHAHARWGAQLVEHLCGEFSFVIWEPLSQRLIAATDRFGIRPLFRMETDYGLAFSDSLHALQYVGGDALTLDEEALGDIASLGFATNPHATIYRQIRRLPPSSIMVLESGTAHQQLYWRIDEPVSPLIRKHDHEYVEEFRELFLTSVRNRIIPDRPVGIMMSGGMDSTSVAVGAALATGDEAKKLVTAHTAVSERYARYEGDLAQQTAARLGIGFSGYEFTELATKHPLEDPDFIPSQPGRIPELIVNLVIARSIASEGGILMSGMGGDMIFGCQCPTILDTLRADGWRGPLTLANHLRQRGRLPAAGIGRLRSRIARQRPREAPLFMDEQFARRSNLRERLADYHAQQSKDLVARLVDPFWTNILSQGATSETAMPLEVAHPFVDQRLLEFCRRLPAGLLRGKRVLRAAMNPYLPEDVLKKPKTLHGYATLEMRQMETIIERHMQQLIRSKDVASLMFDIPNMERSIRFPQAGISHSLAFSEALLWWLEKMQIAPQDLLRDGISH